MRNIAGLKPTNKVFGYILGALFVIAAVAALLGGCGTDEITGGNGNPPVSTGDSLVYKLDSFVISSSSAGVIVNTFTDTAFTNLDSLTITFDISTNMPNDSTLVGLYVYDFLPQYLEAARPHNRSVVWHHRQYQASAMRITLYLRMNNPESIARYLKISNFKIYKLKLN